QRPQSYLVPERTVIRTRSRSRERFRRPSPPNSPPAPAPAPAPVIINNRIYNEHSDSEDDRRGLQVMPARHRDHSRSRSRSGSGYMTREEFEMEQTRRELEEMRLHQARDKEERRAQKEFREEAELQRAKRELDTIRAREQQAKEEARIKKEFELQRLREEEREAEEKEKLEKQAKEAVAKYKQKELERIAQEQKEKDAREKEYKRRLQEDLINSGVDEKHIAAILKKEKVPEKVKAPAALPQVPFVPVGNAVARPTYTRMARRHLSIETLRTYRIEYEVDQVCSDLRKQRFLAMLFILIVCSRIPITSSSDVGYQNGNRTPFGSIPEMSARRGQVGSCWMSEMGTRGEIAMTQSLSG
ncbi:hypothetical protein ACHAO3_003049, partial [Verticillium nonalfalfae]